MCNGLQEHLQTYNYNIYQYAYCNNAFNFADYKCSSIVFIFFNFLLMFKFAMHHEWPSFIPIYKVVYILHEVQMIRYSSMIVTL